MTIGIIGSLLLAGITVSSFLWRRTHETSVIDGKLTTMFEERKSKIVPVESAAETFPELGIQEDYLTVNPYSRPGIELSEVNKIVIHYTANPGTGAKANRDYFENLAVTGDTYASSHFVIDLDGTTLQCIPLNEIAYASNDANSYCISIECCHPDETGEFSTATYNQCVALTAALCSYYHLDPQEDVIRHYDVTGKECPLFYVEHPEEWSMFLDFVEDYMEQ
jgi:N-acetylmuramoyl-L-alanine amidase CwlA